MTVFFTSFVSATAADARMLFVRAWVGAVGVPRTTYERDGPTKKAASIASLRARQPPRVSFASLLGSISQGKPRFPFTVKRLRNQCRRAYGYSSSPPNTLKAAQIARLAPAPATILSTSRTPCPTPPNATHPQLREGYGGGWSEGGGFFLIASSTIVIAASSCPNEETDTR